ncbi:MAG TPA: magnesium transporter [Chitinophagaceae bacterium]|jgi:magnesium transporter|nr:magnesium transporter [Chitinophagaceae bacterium]
MLSLKEIRRRLFKGDIAGLFRLFVKDERAMQPSEVAQIFLNLPASSAVKAFQAFPEKNKISLFPYLDNLVQKQIIKNISKDEASKILNSISSDDLLIFLSQLKGVELSETLEYLNEKNKKIAHNLLGYPKESVARLINTEFVTLKKEMTIEEAMAHLRKFHQDSETANVVYVVNEEGKLIDDVPIRRLVLNEPTKRVEEIMDGFYVKLNIEDSKDTAIDIFKQYDRAALPVTNNDNLLLGVITVDDVLDVEEEKSTKEMQRFGGLESLDYPYVKTPFVSLVRKRAGWLVILFFGEMLTATAMSYFDQEISKAVVLALFVPLIISSGGNSGSQAATLIIRAMALKELSFRDWWYVMRREILSGLTLGIILGAIGFLRITAWENLHWYEYGPHWILLAITIFFSLIGIVMWGTLSGSMIPMILKRFKLDPAVSSAPFVATLVDVTGLVIYFSIAAIILRGTLL